MKTFTREEVATHMSSDDCWMIIKGRVYNVTSVLDTHPGGPECLMDCAGVDATTAFDDVGHSEYAWDNLDDCLVGIIENDPEALEPVTARRPPHAVAGCSNHRPYKRILSKSSASKRSSISSSRSPTKPTAKSQTEATGSIAYQYLGLISLAALGLFSYIFLQYIKWWYW